MNRQTILARINHHLRDSFAETGVVRPLGEIVSRVAVDLRSDRRDSSTRFGGSSQSAGPVIPIEQVAAFVDGGLSSAEADQICEAVMVDNGVLAELVAAVRGSQQPAESLTPLPETLAAQLLAMQSQLPCPGDRQTEVPTESGRWVGSEAAILPPPVATAVIVERPAEKGRVHRREQPASRRWKIAGGIAVAASILAIVALATRQRGAAPNANEIAEHQRVDPDVDRQPSLVPQVDRTAEEPELGPRIVDVDSAPDEANPIDMVKSPEAGTSARQPPSVDSVAGSEASRSPRPVRTEEVPALDNHMPPTPSVTPPPSLPSLRWKEITGLLAAQDLTGSLSSQQRIGGWKSIAAETSPSTDRRLVALRTLPLSRAEADLDGGGRIVIAGDSELTLSRMTRRASAEIDLQHGSVAIIDVPNGTVIDFVHGDRVLASLRWNDHAAAVVRRDAGGFQVDVHHGIIEVNDQPHEDESVVIAGDRSVASIDRPKRLPTWVDRPIDAIGIPRHILAQIGETDDVMRALNRQITELASAQRLSADDQRTLATLATWQAAMADVHLFRMVGSKIPAMRMAALQRLVSLPRNDPRFVPIWANLDRLAANKQRVAQVRRWCEMSQRGIRPNATQVEQMITGLSAQDVTSRAMADYMLRQFFTGGPPFDPNWTGQTQQRAINIWRQRVGLPAGRAAATKAAAGN